ncbi:MAG: phage tail tape measure protein [Christensenellales bacterium]
MAVIRNLVVKIAADISSLSKGFKEAQSKLESLSDNLGNIGGMLSLKVTAPLVMLGKTALNTAADFEQSMANAASVSGASSEELERMTLLARVMGKETVFSASQAADAMYYMASAGYKVEQMENSIAAVLNLAAATQSELAFTTEVVIATLNQFQLDSSEAERVTNVFAAAIGNSQATLDKLKISLGYVGPVANSLGWELEEAAGALSILYNAGYDGSTAGTSLRQALVSLMNPTTKARKIFEELGITLEKLDPTTNKFSDIVNTLKGSRVLPQHRRWKYSARERVRE